MKHVLLYALAFVFLAVGGGLLIAAGVALVHRQAPASALVFVGAGLMGFAALLAAPAQSEQAGAALRRLIKGDSAGAIALPQAEAGPEVNHDPS